MGSLLAPRHQTTLWARDPEVARAVDQEHANPVYVPGVDLSHDLRATPDIEEASSSADLLIVGVPTSGFRKALEDAAPYVRPWVPIVSLAKGLERGSLLRMTEVIKEVLPGHPAAALTGPNIAREILARKAAASVVASVDLDVACEIQRVVTRGVLPRLRQPGRHRM